MSARVLRLIIGALAAALLALAAVSGAVDGVMLWLAPALVLLAPLLAGRYLGEERIARIALAGRPARRPRATDTPVPRRRPRAVLGHGGLLLASRLAGRGPPALLLA